MTKNYDYLFSKKKEYMQTSEFFLFLFKQEQNEDIRKENLDLYLEELRKMAEIDRKLEAIRSKYKKYQNMPKKGRVKND